MYSSKAKYVVILDYSVAGSSTKVGSQSYSYTYYQRYFQMKVIDTISDTPVYETKAASEGSSATFGQVAECIFDMALADFPLQSSSSGSVLMDECGT